MFSEQSIQLNRYRVTFTFGTGPPSAHLRDEPRGAKNGARLVWSPSRLQERVGHPPGVASLAPHSWLVLSKAWCCILGLWL
ncbi:hypothetical protein ATANTOWER_014506 [Ataeniobius toweri]|uniref:Uncharacterized protein n=1 Tax=Ataeniobius toweri TaxID=208326 RepID=A0ABU7AHD0_9TELE|nr:hypothetical protein [Ataeniobius toweri]